MKKFLHFVESSAGRGENSVSANLFSFSSPFAPLTPDGPLPPGLTDERLSHFYHAISPNLRPKKLLSLLGENADTLFPRGALRKLMDTKTGRSKTVSRHSKELIPELHQVIWRWLISFRFANRVVSEIVEASLISRSKLVFLAPEQFAAAIKEKWPALASGKESVSSESAEEALALAALAFGLLQPADAEAILGPVLELGPDFRAYFGASDIVHKQVKEMMQIVNNVEESFGVPISKPVEALECLDGLSTELKDLADQLRLAAEGITARLEVPARNLAMHLREIQEKWESVLLWFQGYRDANNLSVAEKDFKTLMELRAVIAALTVQQSNFRELALKTLRAVSCVKRQNGAEEPALLAVHQETEAALSLLKTDSKDARALAESLTDGTHPLAALVSLVEMIEELPQERLEQLREEVARAFGDQAANLASRGRLVMFTPLVLDSPHAEPPTAENGESVSETSPDLHPNNVESAAAQLLQAKDSSEPQICVSPELPDTILEASEIPPKTTDSVNDSISPSSAPKNAISSAEEPCFPNSSEIVSDDSAISPESLSGCHNENGFAIPSADDPGQDVLPISAEPFELSNQTPETQRNQSSDHTNESAPELDEAVDVTWEMVRQRRFGLAWHLSVMVTPNIERVLQVPSPDLVKLMVLNQTVYSSASDVTEEVQNCVTKIYDILQPLQSEEMSVREGFQMMIGAALLKPSLLAIQPEMVHTLLRNLHIGGMLGRLSQKVIDFYKRGIEISPALLKGLHEKLSWSQTLENHRQYCREWLKKNRTAKIIYSPTTDVWQNWLSESGPLGKMFDAVIADRVSECDAIAQCLENWKKQGSFEAEVVRTDKSIRGRIADLRAIEARAIRALDKHTKEAFEVIRQWLQIHSQKPFEHPSSRQEAITQFRQEALSLIPQARKEIDSFLVRHGNALRNRAFVEAIFQSLEDFASLFELSEGNARDFTDYRQLLSEELLVIPGLRLDEQFEAVPDMGQNVLQLLVERSRNGIPDWFAAFDKKCEERDHLATERILFQQKRMFPVEQLEALRIRREEEIACCRKRLAKRVEELEHDLSRAANEDLMPISEYLTWQSRLSAIDSDQVTIFPEAEKVLRELETDLDRWKDARIAHVRDRLRHEVKEIDGSLNQRIEKALENWDFLAANEYIDLAVDGRSLEMEEEGDPLASYFPGFIRHMIHLLGRSELKALVGDIKERKIVGPLDMSQIPGAQAESAARMVKAWLRAKAKLSNDFKPALRDLMEGLGFEDIAISGAEIPFREKKWRGILTVKPVMNRAVCSIPAFGSDAGGRYQLMCVWDRPSEDEIVNSAPANGNSPLMILYFGQMTEVRRRALADLSRTRNRSMLVIDETLILFLCGTRDSRLPILFRCALPFTVADPYTTTASLVPVEMFFGREKEQQSVASRTGTNLVFGGRQLGKTALLRQVERRYHDLEKGLIVRWVDLLDEHIGDARPIEDIWAVIAKVLEEEKVLPKGVVKAETIKRLVKEWLGEDPHRQIVLLLDEADMFLESDSRNRFKNLIDIKGLMDSTDRRFKVVFAGLHNVQRTSRDSNAPIGHLNEPICIGPLLNEREAREAMRMIKEPLHDLGYRFESMDLPLRIISHTNYYPSLIQIFCKHLLGYLNSPQRSSFDMQKSPPFVITSQHLKAVMNEELRRKIYEKFRLTLDLDPRYRVISLIIAYESVQQKGDSLVRGVDPEWVRDEVLDWWPDGFKHDKSIEGVRVILDEMIGLGILRRVDGRSYTLRSPNLVNLLGSRKEIESQLLDATSLKSKVEYEASSFHRFANLGNRLSQSPLTAFQESDLQRMANEVVILFGSRLSGLDQVPRFLQAVDWAYSVTLDSNSTQDTLLSRLEVPSRNGEERLSLLVVPPETGWTGAWVHQAHEILARKRSLRHCTRVIFLANPDRAWAWLGFDNKIRKSMLENCTREMSILPWTESAVRFWLEHAFQYSADDKICETIRRVTGFWHLPLGTLIESCQDSENGFNEAFHQLNGDLRLLAHAPVVEEIPPSALSLLSILAAYNDPVREDEIQILHKETEDVASLDIVHWLGWADRLGFTRRDAQGKWVLDPLIQRVMESWEG